MSIIGGVNLGNLTDYLFFFANGSSDANWQGATKGFVGNVAVDGIQASERTSGGVPYAGTIYTNDTTLGPWQNIIKQNTMPTIPVNQAAGVTGQVALISSLETDLTNAMQQINGLSASAGFSNRSAISLDGLNTQNGINEVFVINITSGLSVSSQINITGDAGDVFILRWDTDGIPTNGYQGQVKFQSGGAIVPHGGLKPSNFINVAGDIDSSGGGSNPAVPYPQGPRYIDGTGALIYGAQDFNGGGFFTGYWLTTGDSTTGETHSLSNGIFVGGWYTTTNKFSMTSGTSGVYVSPNPATFTSPSINVKKYISVDNGLTYEHVTSPGPSLGSGVNPKYKFVVTNTGKVTLTNIVVNDNDINPVFNATLPSLAPGDSHEWTATGTWQPGNQSNTVTATGDYSGVTYTSFDNAYYVGTAASINVIKYISSDNGATYVHVTELPGPTINSGINPKYKFVVTNNGAADLTNVVVNDNDINPVFNATLPSLASGDSHEWTATGTWAGGQQTNNVTATGDFGGDTYTSSDKSFYFGTAASIKLIKYISPNDGLTWIDVSAAPGPHIYAGTNPQYKFVVTNTSNVTLENIVVKDSVLGTVGTVPSLGSGEFAQWIVTGTWMAGQNSNIGTASGDYQGVTYTDSHLSFYYGIIASINIVKYVSSDGINWFDANTAPGPSINAGTNPQYKFVVTNNSAVTLTNIVVTDSLVNPPFNETLPSLASGDSHEWTSTGTWASGQQTNTAKVTGIYNGVTYTASDTAFYFGANPSINVIKYVSSDGINWFDANTAPGLDIISGTNPKFKFVITNTGNVPLTNITLRDQVDGLLPVNIPVTITTLNPQETFTAFTTGIWTAGQQMDNATTTGMYNDITYADTDPAYYFGTTIQINPIKSVDESIATIGDILHYTVKIINNGNTTAENVVFNDNIPDSTTFVSGSLTVNGIQVDASPDTGIKIGNILPQKTVIVKFNVKVISIPDPPNEPKVDNTAVVNFDVEINGKLQPEGPVNSNTVETDLINVQLQVIKIVDKDIANIGDTLTYSVVIKNIGNVIINNIIFNDNIPDGTILIGTQPVKNINIGTLAPGESRTITFQVKIVSKPCPPKLINKAVVIGNYTNVTVRTITVESNEAITYVGVKIFKQISVDENLTIPTVKPNAEDILEVIADVEITYTNVIKTPIVTSYEGQQLTGWKLIVEGKIKQKIVYISDDQSQSVHAAEFDVPFSTFLVLPKDYKVCKQVKVEGIIEDVFVKLVDKRTIFKNVTLMLQGKVNC